MRGGAERAEKDERDGSPGVHYTEAYMNFHRLFISSVLNYLETVRCGAPRFIAASGALIPSLFFFHSFLCAFLARCFHS